MDEQIGLVLDFWFSVGARDTPTIDSRMDRWFSPDPAFDEQIRQRFGALSSAALAGELDGWAATARGRLALILLLDQFPRHLHRGRAEAFAGDARALRLCVEGARDGKYRELNPLEQAFFFMPLQHAENLKAQEKGVRIYSALVDNGGDTLRETLETFAQFAELHRDIIASHGRFPHRNRALGRSSTAEEAEYLDGGALSFGQ
ncbi:MAG: DUF924 domain-containing protein [Chromatiales bacterium]|nr:DUF924 domain-containing protein [Chromatiales bacterium]